MYTNKEVLEKLNVEVVNCKGEVPKVYANKEVLEYEVFEI